MGFKIGDLVRLKDESNPHGQGHTGEGTILSLADSFGDWEGCVGVRWDYYTNYRDSASQNDFHWVQKDLLELAAPTEAEIEAALLSIANSAETF